ncbi:hypothetical protein [Lutimonas sp.]|uniref:hypothetical protein n=1 Tax=Lutimonas sp. TaxID=1872403 RepID=UPI003D9B705D
MKFLVALFISVLFTASVYSQDSLGQKTGKLDFLHQIDDQKWKIQLPIWIPGLRGEFAYAAISVLPEEEEKDIIGRLNKEIGVTFYFIGDIQYTPNKWLFSFNGFYTSLASDLIFENIDKVKFLVAIEGAILRGVSGYQVFKKENPSTFFNAEIHPFIGFRYVDLNIYSQKTTILDIRPAWFEPLIGIHADVSHKRWFFSGEADVGGFSINNHWSTYVSIESNYRFNKLIGAGFGWTYLSFNYNENYEARYLDLNIALSGPVVNVNFNF